MGRSTVHYADSKSNNILKALHNKLRPAGTPVQRVEYIIELLLLRIFEVKLKREPEFKDIRKLFDSKNRNENKLFYYLQTISSADILSTLNQEFFPFYADILNKAREVLQGNMSTKVQDQLVLIQEVFANSNFTNNVQSGNLEDIINLIAEIDEECLLNTDLLGDTIESALSETGGTKDIGLFRTPAHVRHMMVGLLAPTIKDTIFDPACGTGGFLFDSYEYVMERISPEQKWPGPKAHIELQKWFKDFFKNNTADMPSLEHATNFYRAGVFGVEYLGMIRKMAAVNFYVRGLNPHNIEQGDSLAKFDTDLKIKDTYSVVLANPPFGAERDQKAYPNVWEEYAKESETTILFVKLMLDALKPGGRCAVVVSEGFLTWEQNSARALRRMLLEDANLQAVIGLPQGVFVSKGGQGPKTSVLLFEKGRPTEHVWFYNVENDGFTKGANRTPVKGCQFTELLELYHNYVRHGKIPQETPGSFSLSVGWLKVVDPRVKEKIRKETRDAMEIKREEARIKLIERLDKRLEAALATQFDQEKYDQEVKKFGRDWRKKLKAEKDKNAKEKLKKKYETARKRLIANLDKKLENPAPPKFDQVRYDAEVWKFETTWDQKIQSEITKRIDRAHLYSFNSATYRSSLNEEQIKEWHKVLKTKNIRANGDSLDKKYDLLQKASLQNAAKHISGFDPENAIEADIVREYVANIGPEKLEKYPVLKKIDGIFKSGARYPMVKLRNYLILNRSKCKPWAEPDVKYKVLGVSNETGVFINQDLKPQQTNQSYYLVERNQFCYNPYRVNVGSIGINEFEFENQIISGAYVVFGTDEEKLHPKYLMMLVKNHHFLEYVNSKASGGVRMNFTFAHIQDWEIPLPPLEKQLEIAEQVERQKAISEGAEKILENWEIMVPESFDKRILSDFIVDSLYGISSKLQIKGTYPVLRMNNLDTKGIWYMDDMKYISDEIPEARKLVKGDFLFNRTNSLELVGKSGVIDFDFDGTYAGYLIRLRFNRELDPNYLRYLFATERYRKHFSEIAKPAGGQANINADELSKIQIDYIPVEEQQKLVSELHAEMQTLEKIREMKTQAETRIQSIINEIWEN